MWPMGSIKTVLINVKSAVESAIREPDFQFYTPDI